MQLLCRGFYDADMKQDSSLCCGLRWPQVGQRKRCYMGGGLDAKRAKGRIERSKREPVRSCR